MLSKNRSPCEAKPFGYQHSSKYLLSSSTEEESHTGLKQHEGEQTMTLSAQ